MDKEKTDIMIIDENTLRSKIYIVCGQQVMLDTDLAEIYGYDHKGFNKQVKNNSERFDDEFRFQLTKDEVADLRRKNYAANISPKSRSMPYAYTEQGIYMLMTVLKGDLAITQSKALIKLFKRMKDYIIQNQQLMITQKDYVALVEKVNSNTADILTMKDNMVTKADLSDFMKIFDSGIEHEEILILDGEPFKADEAYQKIYRKAKRKIAIVDDYIGVKTLLHLAHAKPAVKITIISDNKARPRLTQAEYQDFLTENPGRNISFLQSLNQSHDRYIVLDEGTKDMKVYHCGASSKDAGKRITTITRIMNTDDYKATIRSMLTNPILTLR